MDSRDDVAPTTHSNMPEAPVAAGAVFELLSGPAHPHDKADVHGGGSASSMPNQSAGLLSWRQPSVILLLGPRVDHRVDQEAPGGGDVVLSEPLRTPWAGRWAFPPQGNRHEVTQRHLIRRRPAFASFFGFKSLTFTFVAAFLVFFAMPSAS